ncbi:hypothetical protein CIB48_g10815 [Xylaria polymorpha]|nr:hypothetical protein CIB48_g10815 [Xylaria polymorpha]
MPDTSLQKILVQTIDTKVNEKHVRELRRELRLDFSEEAIFNVNHPPLDTDLNSLSDNHINIPRTQNSQTRKQEILGSHYDLRPSGGQRRLLRRRSRRRCRPCTIGLLVPSDVSPAVVAERLAGERYRLAMSSRGRHGSKSDYACLREVIVGLSPHT